MYNIRKDTKMNTKLNTKNKGIFYFILTKEGKDFVAVCLNLNLVEYGKNPELLKKSIEEAAFSHLEAVRDHNLPDEHLNVLAPKKYWTVYREGLEIAQSIEKQLESSKSKPAGIVNFFEYSQRPYNHQPAIC